MIQEESAILWEMIVCVILSKKVHINMCPILDGYGVMTVFFNSRTRPRVNHISQLARSRTPLAYLDTFEEYGEGGGVCIRLEHAQFTTERQPVLRPAVAFSKTNFKHRSVQIKGNFMKFTLHLYFKYIMCYADLLFCSVYCQ